MVLQLYRFYNCSSSMHTVCIASIVNTMTALSYGGRWYNYYSYCTRTGVVLA